MTPANADCVQLNGLGIRLIKGDITDLAVEAFVFYARSDLALGSGFGTAITVRGGATIQKELQGLAPVPAGEAVVSAAGRLKADYIIHAVGPKFQEEDTEAKLRTTVLNALKRADEKEVRTLALPAMGAGFYGIPPEVCARVMLEAIGSHPRGAGALEELVICVLDTRQYDAFQAALAALE